MQRVGRVSAGKIVTLVVWIIALMAAGGAAWPQTPAASSKTAGPAVGTHIKADGGPYHFTFDGVQGMFKREALGPQPELDLPLTLLHTDPGPRGYANYLAWFLAREGDSFDILWCYLNDSGDEFYCWLYSYPSNQLTSLRFEGDYHFVAPDEPVPPTPLQGFDPRATPHYAGPDFVYRDWTRLFGRLASLDLHPALKSTFVAADTGNGMAQASSEATAGSAPTRTIAQLRVYPMHEVHVASSNGWRSEGWRELHCLAYDNANQPYYLILYSNSTHGYVIDLTKAQIYTADYGAKVTFATSSSPFGDVADQVTGPPELRVRQYERHEISLKATQSYANPYTDVLLEADFTAPNGQKTIVPGFWDGGNVWKIRFAPTLVGEWAWHTRSNDDGLNAQSGNYTCIAGSDMNQGFLAVDQNNRHHFVFDGGAPFLPVSIAYPVHHALLLGSTTAMQMGESHLTSLQSAPAGSGAGVDLYAAFQKDVDALVALGFNRFVGEYLIDDRQFPSKTQRNEGGPPFIDYDPDRLNPAYFQAMDKRLDYCNANGVVPDIGLGMLNADLFRMLSDSQMRQLWRYVLARYASYNVCWNLFGRDIGVAEPDSAELTVEEIARLTQRYDPNHHPLTTLLPGSAMPRSTRVANARLSTQSPRGMGAGPDYVVSPAGLPLWPDPSRRIAESAMADLIARMATPEADTAWMDVITLNGGALEAVTADYAFNKPVVIYDRSAPPNPDAARFRLWETLMRGGYWARDTAAGVKGNLLDSPETRWAAYCARLFSKTRYWRLAPHNEMLKDQGSIGTGRVQSAGADLNAAPATANGKGSSDIVSADSGYDPVAQQPADSIFVLADPAWEYVLYFEHGGEVTLDLLEATGRINASWFNPRTGEFARQDVTMGGGHRTFRAPDNSDWVLYLSRR